ncbi:MAG: dTMP kinase [Candidatus Aminicenantes bacterium]|nr:dTMP kinase [Candidatus Aminicenantes bacterium]
MRLCKGVLIVFEGIDGSGKSTQARRLLRKLRTLGYETVSFREPTRGKWGRMIKRKSKDAGSLTPEEELDLFVKDRKENVRKNLRPALAAKKAVILDRYYFSTIAYQGAKGISTARIRSLNERFAVKPDLVFILDIGAAGGLGRIRNRKRKDLLFERERYLARVRRIFRSFRGKTFVHLDAALPEDDLGEMIAARVLPLLQRWGTSP